MLYRSGGLPRRDGLGVWPDVRVVGTLPPPPSPWSSPSPRSALWRVLVWGLELVSYERSRRETGTILHHFAARALCAKYKTLKLWRYKRYQFFQHIDSERCSGPNIRGPEPGPMGLAHGPHASIYAPICDFHFVNIR